MSFIEHVPLSWQCCLHLSENMTLFDICRNSNYPWSKKKHHPSTNRKPWHILKYVQNMVKIGSANTVNEVNIC